MPPEARKYLEDVQQACELLLKFTSGKSIVDYEGDPMLRSAVERQFEIIGEAVSGLARINPPSLTESLTMSGSSPSATY